MTKEVGSKSNDGVEEKDGEEREAVGALVMGSRDREMEKKKGLVSHCSRFGLTKIILLRVFRLTKM